MFTKKKIIELNKSIHTHTLWESQAFYYTKRQMSISDKHQNVCNCHYEEFLSSELEEEKEMSSFERMKYKLWSYMLRKFVMIFG